ncbi:hypothetical protein [Subtercola frigoramans]|uniref:FMN-dependent dehydrogenase domain-containing protein n=1 Tax=Subtercola frigoramans TaxID=120298 RepID=A0ABS2L8N2_9MICO|nr:hypothetical protein [Subtercola frigoramans]MBM7473456.1 hypothetical protein [Subtercola frigoramans]
MTNDMNDRELRSATLGSGRVSFPVFTGGSGLRAGIDASSNRELFDTLDDSVALDDRLCARRLHLPIVVQVCAEVSVLSRARAQTAASA